MQGQTLLHMAVSYAVPFVIGGCKEKALDFHRIYGAGEEVLGDDGDEPKVIRGVMSAKALIDIKSLIGST